MKFRRTHKKTGIFEYELLSDKFKEFIDCKIQLKILSVWITIKKYTIVV